MTALHSGPYPSQDPNPSDEEKYRQAGEILGRLRKPGATATSVAADMAMSRRTFYNRLLLINAQDLPSRDALRVIHYERLEELWAGATSRLEDEISNADYFRGVAESRQVLARQAALLRIEEVEPTVPEPGEDVEDDDWESESDAS